MKNNQDIEYKKFIDYNNAILNNENYFKKLLENPYENEKNEGYLIDFNDLEEVKQKLNHNEFKKYYNKQDEIIINFDKEKFNNIKKIKQIKFKDSKYLISMILNDNKFLLINSELWNLISDENNKNDKPYIFTIHKKSIINLIFKSNEKIFLKYNNFYFDKNSISFTIPYFEEIKEIYEAIDTYYYFEKKFLSNIEKNKCNSNQSYLVSESWLNEWKNYTNYQNIKKYYFKQNQKINKKIKKEIINDIIYYIQRKK